MTEVGC